MSCFYPWRPSWGTYRVEKSVNNFFSPQTASCSCSHSGSLAFRFSCAFSSTAVHDVKELKRYFSFILTAGSGTLLLQPLASVSLRCTFSCANSFTLSHSFFHSWRCSSGRSSLSLLAGFWLDYAPPFSPTECKTSSSSTPNCSSTTWALQQPSTGCTGLLGHPWSRVVASQSATSLSWYENSPFILQHSLHPLLSPLWLFHLHRFPIFQRLLLWCFHVFQSLLGGTLSSLVGMLP